MLNKLIYLLYRLTNLSKYIKYVFICFLGSVTKRGIILEIKGQITEIIYTNEINGYMVAEFKTEEETTVITGYLPFINDGDSLRLVGKFVTHPDYGRQFKIETFEKIMPENVEALEKSYAYISDHVRNIKGNYESAAQAYIDAVNNAHRMNESQENMLSTINDSMKHIVHTNEKVDEVIAVMEERQERIENLISHINEISTTIETLQKLESQLNRITNK